MLVSYKESVIEGVDCAHNFIIIEVKHEFTSNGEREFVRDQVSSLFVVYCSSFLLLN